MTPSRPLRPCATPGCTNTVSKGHCDVHQSAIRKRQRRSGGSRPSNSGPRPYDRRAWRDRVRPQQLHREPLCEFCLNEGTVEPATEVDHIDGDAWNHRIDNLRSLCKPCHTKRTNRDQMKSAAK